MFGVANTTLATSIGAAWLAYIAMRLITVRRFYKDLPKPPHSFLWGHLKLMGEITSLFPPETHPQSYWTEIATRYDMPDIFYLDLWPFGPATMILTSADAAAEIMSARSYPIHPWVDSWLTSMLGRHVIAAVPGGPRWKALHQMMGPSFTPAAVKAQMGLIVEHVLLFHQKLREKAVATATAADDDQTRKQQADVGGGKDQESFAMTELTGRVVFDVTSCVVLGFSLEAQQRGSALLVDLQTSFALGGILFNSWNPLTTLRAWWVMRGARGRADAVIRAELRRRQEALQRRGEKEKATLPSRRKAGTVMDRMILSRIEELGIDAGGDLDEEFVEMAVSNLKGLLAAGQGTTSDTISMAYMLLGLHPEVMKRMREEHDRVFDPDLEKSAQMLEATPTKINELEYTTAVIKETLRLFPIGFGVRAAPDGLSNLEYKGTSYPITGQMIAAVNHTTHYNPDYFPDPTRFLPDRFLAGYEPEFPRYAWRPFERGLRACMGQELAVDEMRAILLLTARWFDFEPVLPRDRPAKTKVKYTDWEERLGKLAFQELKMSAVPRDGMPMRIKLSGRR